MKNIITHPAKYLKQYLFIVLCICFTVAGFSLSRSRRFLLRDKGISQLGYIDMSNQKNNWFTSILTGREIQLVGHGRVLVGTGNGYEEHDIITGTKVYQLNSFPGTIATLKLRNGNTLLTGVNWQGKQGIVLLKWIQVVQ